MTRRLQDIALVLLAVVAAGLMVLAFQASRTLPQPTGAGSGATSQLGSTPVAAPDDQAAATTEALSEDGLSATADVDPALAPARAVVTSAKPIVISVLGDSTSNARQEWVHRWALDLSADRPVTISHWNEATQTGFVEPDELSNSGDGSPVTIWSGSQSGASAAYSLGFLSTLIPEQPDLVLLNYGHNQTPESVSTDFPALLEALRATFGEVPVVVVLQQPQIDDANAQVRGLIEEWADSEGLATIDVAAAFLATGDYTDLLSDELHPNDAGSRLWEQTVAVALGG